MADAAIARREARRRKILENSQNRLQRIAGKAGEECCRESPVHSPISEYQETVSSEISNSKAPLHNGVLSSSLLSPENFILDPEATTNHNSIINDLASLLPPNVSGNSTSEAVQKPSLMEYSITYKYKDVVVSTTSKQF
ncbi:unnamed protein product [Leptosia nina]|uniref:Uncharacterized protein n=1 Tax=Leptosia nina TaxID=320188 RepID=A0AAV1K414_9NEOP